VTQLAGGIQDAWDVVCVPGGRCYVSERIGNRVLELDSETGAITRVVLSGAPMTFIGTDRKARLNVGVALSVAQEQPILSPEALAVHDGWLYVGSTAQQQIRRVHLTTGELQVVCAPSHDNNSRFTTVSVSPDGWLATSTWSATRGGMPEVFEPVPTGSYTHTKRIVNLFTGNAPIRGKGGNWQSMGYSAGACIDRKRLIWSSAEEGLGQITMALPTDPPIDLAKYNAGLDEFVLKGYPLVFGENGFGFDRFALPWGESEEMDYYLEVVGHVRT
jgi:sugar lactone lactonase YvrE